MTKLPIPTKVLDQHTIVLGKTRSGKSSKLRLMVEALLDIGHPVCIIDPKGDWWGLKSSADGKNVGYAVIIFGGKYADIPINEHSGAHVAELVATGNRPCIIDLGGWRQKDRTRFFIDFAEAFFIHTRGLRWLVIDECHNFVPKGKVFSPDVGEMLHWGNRLASEGQGKGIILLSASQRPQKVHNDYLTSHETLVACRVIHKADRDAVKDWIDGCGDPVIGKDMIGTLAAMQRPEAWVWSPEIGFGPKRITFPMFETYDSFQPQSAKAGRLKGWAAVNLDEVKVKLAKVVDEIAANDPAKLKAEIARLRKDLAKASQQTSKPVEKVITIDPKALQRAREDGFAEGARHVLDGFKATLPGLTVSMGTVFTAAHEQSLQRVQKQIQEGLRVFEKIARTAKPGPALAPPPAAPARSSAAPAPRRAVAAPPAGTLPKAERAILAVLANFPATGAPSNKVAMFAGYSIKSSSFSNALSSLRTAGLIQPGQPIRITAAGVVEAGDVDALPTGDALLAYWKGHQSLGKAEREILTVLVDSLPSTMSRAEVAAASGYSLTSSSFSNALSTLRTLDLISGRGDELSAAGEFAQ